MKEYQEIRDWEQDPAPIVGYKISGRRIPPNARNRDYRLLLEELDLGEAIILPAVEPPPFDPTVIVEADIVKTSTLLLIDENGDEQDVTEVILNLIRPGGPPE